MTPILYIPEAQLTQVLEDAGRLRRSRLAGVAFEWPGEEVCHLFYQRPAVHPAAPPIPGFFVVANDATTEKGTCQSLNNSLAHRLIAEGGQANSPVVFISKEDPTAFEAFRLGDRTRMEVHLIPGAGVLQSRTRGILETDLLKNRRVCIVGVGSFGSTLAIELAKAGVGHFDLIDPDRLEPSNISRHACGITDLGRYKTRAVRDAICARNPEAVVDTLELDINLHLNALTSKVQGSDLLICVTDEKRSRFNCNSLAVRTGTTALFGRAITRAAGGDVFRYRPGGPCLACLFTQDIVPGHEEVSSSRQALRDAPAYMAEEDVEALVQPGLSVDIAPMIQMMSKLALVELCRGTAGPMATLEEDLESPFYLWANRRELIYRDWQPMKYTYNRNSILRWYGVRAEPLPDCLTCSLA